MFGNVTTQIDQNLMVMQIIEEVSVKHGLAALLHEKPFQALQILMILVLICKLLFIIFILISFIIYHYYHH